MHTLRGRNVNSVWPKAIELMRYSGVKRSSRNGPVLEYPEPVATVYDRPLERVLLDPIRDANPFLHLFESLWILAGRNDVAWPAQFAKQVATYSDDGKTFHGAYGHRLRRDGRDQLEYVLRELKKNPESRRAVLSIWNAAHDLGTASKDLPCNTTLYVKIRDGRLLLTVCNRSNDMVWGLYGANVVQWSVLQEYLAARIGVAVGPLTTLSDSFHVYLDNPTWKHYEAHAPSVDLPYRTSRIATWPLVDVPCSFDEDLQRWMNDPSEELGPMFPTRQPCLNSFFWRVAGPLYRAWAAHKKNKTGLETLRKEAREYEEEYGSQGTKIDWFVAAEAWLERREGDARQSAASPVRAGVGRRGRVGGSAQKVRGQLEKTRRR